MIRLTVDFISKDTKKYGIPKSNCLSCNDYDCLKQFAVKEKLTKVDSLIIRLHNKKINPTEYESLKQFEASIITNIVSGKNEYRKELNGYANFVKNLDKIATNVNSKGETKQTNHDSSANQKKDSLITPIPEDAVQLPVPQPAESETTISPRTWVSYGIIGILTILVGFLFFQLFKASEKIHNLKDERSEGKSNNKQMTINLNNKIISLETELKKEKENVLELTNLLQNEKRKSQVSQPILQAIETTQEPVFQQPQKQESPIKFARYADQGDGFSVSELLTEENSETIFQIKVTGATAKFRITNNRNAQRYALSNASYFFSKACKYDSSPTMESIITTDIEGDLKLQGGKWQIQSPAKISFR